MSRQQHTIRCRRAGTGDAVALAHFARRTFVESYGHVNDPEDIARYLAESFGLERQRETLANSDIETLSCEVDDELAGYAELWASARPKCIDDENVLEIRRFYIDQPWQGKGVAAVLMTAVLDAAEARRANGVWLGVWEQSPRPQAFYRKSGFIKVGEQIFKLASAMQTDHILFRPL